MAITAVDKIKINKYLKENAIGNIYYQDMCDALGKKVKITDIEFLEYFSELVASEFRKETKISAKQVAKVVSVVAAFLGWINEAGNEIEETVLDKIRSFKELYEDYLERTGVERESLLDEYIDSTMNTLNELYPSRTNGESVSKYINMVAELNAQIKKLEKELAEAERMYQNEVTSSTQKQERLETLSSDVVNLGRDVRSKDKEIESLTAKIEELNGQVESLEDELLKSKLEVIQLTPLKQQVQDMFNELSTLKKQIDDEAKAKRRAERLQTKETKVEALMYEYLLLNDANVDEIVNYVRSQGTTTDTKQVADLLRRMRTKINIESPKFRMQPRYKIVEPRITTDGRFEVDVPYNCKHYDIMLVSDFHVEDFNAKTMHGFNEMNEYCAKQGIHLVLNIGDFFDGYDYTTFKYENAVQNYKLVEEAIKKIPYNPGLYHAILSGNHERNILKYGFNPIEMIANEREDIIDLGFSHSTIELVNPVVSLGEFDIHHPNTFDFPIDLTEDGLDLEAMKEYLKNIYTDMGRERNDSYIDIFGHTHKSQFNYLESYCYVPSLLEGKGKRGACHLRVYIDDNTGIEYMVFMPLSFNTSNKLVKNNEIVYQKLLSR